MSGGSNDGDSNGGGSNETATEYLVGAAANSSAGIQQSGVGEAALLAISPSSYWDAAKKSSSADEQ